MQNQLLARKANLETTLSRVAGVAVEITVRGLHEFTFSAEGNALPALERVRAFLAGCASAWSASYDAECDLSCAYATLHLTA